MSEGSVLLTGEKFTRRKILDDLYRKVQSSSIEVEISNQISEIIQVAANDSVSTFREKAARILLAIFSSFNPTTEQISGVYHLISLRVKDEPVEETRLAFAQLFNSCIKRSVETVDLDPIANTLKAALNDPFHEVDSCMCLAIVELSKKSGFNFMADYFVQPLLEGLKRKQVSVRVDCARALHPVLLSSTLLIPDAAPRLFRFYSEDENPKLQLAIVTSVGSTAIEITPTDHSFHHLLPILLVGMCSEFEPVREQSEKLWDHLINEHGRKYNVVNHFYT